MRKIYRWLSATSALAASLFLWSCDNIGDTTQPELEPSPMVVMSTSGQRFTVAYEENPESGSVSATIGYKGGVLGMGRHAIYVAEGTVGEPTVFTISRAAEGSLRLKLTAGENNSVGAAGFSKPVRLLMYMGNAANVDANRYSAKVLYFRPDGLVDELETRVYGYFAVTNLDHFSLYGLGWP